MVDDEKWASIEMYAETIATDTDRLCDAAEEAGIFREASAARSAVERLREKIGRKDIKQLAEACHDNLLATQDLFEAFILNGHSFGRAEEVIRDNFSKTFDRLDRLIEGSP